MKLLLSFIAMICVSNYSTAAVAPSSAINCGTTMVSRPTPSLDVLSLRLKDVRRIIGRKLTLKEKIAFKVYQWKVKQGLKSWRADEKSKKGKAAMILGIVGLATLFIPYVNIIALPAAILAVVFGNIARNENPKDRQAKTGVLLGWITIGIFVVALVIVFALFSSPHFWFG